MLLKNSFINTSDAVVPTNVFIRMKNGARSIFSLSLHSALPERNTYLLFLRNIKCCNALDSTHNLEPQDYTFKKKKERKKERQKSTLHIAVTGAVKNL